METAIHINKDRLLKAAEKALKTYRKNTKDYIDGELEKAWLKKKNSSYVKFYGITEDVFKKKYYDDADDLVGANIWFYKVDFWNIERDLKTLISMAKKSDGNNVLLSKKDFTLVEKHIK